MLFFFFFPWAQASRVDGVARVAEDTFGLHNSFMHKVKIKLVDTGLKTSVPKNPVDHAAIVNAPFCPWSSFQMNLSLRDVARDIRMLV